MFGKYDLMFVLIPFSEWKLKLKEFPPCRIFRIESMEISFTPSSISSADNGGLLGLAFQSGPPLF